MDLSVLNNGDMPEHIARMVGEYASLIENTEKLSKFLEEHAPDTICEDGKLVSEQEYHWMKMQLQTMESYALCLEHRAELNGYDFKSYI